MRTTPRWTVLWGMAALMVLAGCASHKNDPIVLRCADYGDPPEMKMLDELASEFEKDHPGVKVRMVRTPWAEYITKILTQFSANDAPDVIALAAEQVVNFSSRNVLVDLTPYVKKDATFRPEDFYPEAIRQYTVDGVLTAIPRDIAPIGVIYYNKKKFDEAGIPYPKNDWTYTEFLRIARKLTKTDVEDKVPQFGFVDEWINYEAWIYAFGGNLTDDERKPTRCTVDSPEAIAGVQFRADLMHKYKVSPRPSNITAMGGVGNADLFMNGTAAMFHSGIWQSPNFRAIKDFDWDVVEFPKGPGDRRAFSMSASGYAILRTCKRPDLAFELVRYLSGETGQKYMASTGLTQPALLSVARSKAFLDGQKPLSKGFLVNAVKFGHYQPFDPNETEWINRVASALDQVWNGTETPEKALKKVAAEVNSKFFGKR